MKPHSTWSYTPYKPLLFEAGDIYICRIVPLDTSLHIEWLKAEAAENYCIYCRQRGIGDFAQVGITEDCCFPANHSKFEIKYDGKSGNYYTLASRIPDRENVRSRNLLSLMRSKDLQKWEVAADILDKRGSDPVQVGFQYVDFEIEEDDILFLCRTSINGAHSFHDSNFSVFGRIANFRNLNDLKNPW